MKIKKPTDNELRSTINGINIFSIIFYLGFAAMGLIVIAHNNLVNGLQIIMLAIIILLLFSNSQKLNKVRLEIRQK